MSHVMELELVGFTNEEALKKACDRLGLELKYDFTEEFFDESKVTGHAVKLDGWLYHVVFDLKNSKVSMDHDNGRWGRIEAFDKLRQAYAVEMELKHLRKRGTSLKITESLLPDGTIQLESIEM